MALDPNIKILLVEDAGVMRKMERKTLATLGFENVVEAVDGDDAATKLQQDPDVDLVISDWNMPNMNGFELLVWMRERDAFRDLPFLMATGRGEKREVEEAREAGVSSFISKPFDAAELKSKIEEAFGVLQTEETAREEKPRLTEDGKVRIRASHIQITDHLALGVLKHLIGTGEMKPQHFELETEILPGWNPVAESLEKNNSDVAFILAPLAMDLFNYDVPISLTLFTHKNGSIFVRSRRGGEYTDPFDKFFIDKSFYIPHFMSVHHMLAHLFFKKIGLRPGMPGKEETNVNFEVVAPIKMPEFLNQNPNSSGFLVAEPLGTKAIANGVAELQALSSELWENHPCCVCAVQNEMIENYPDAIGEFTRMIVQAGKYIEQKPGAAAEIAVNFLDPRRNLGLKVPLLKNVLTEPKGIKFGDLYPVVDDLNRFQEYMHYEMGVGGLIDVDKFVDLQFADDAVPGAKKVVMPSIFHDDEETSMQILNRKLIKDKEQTTKALLNKEGKYLMFALDDQYFGIDILKIIEISRMMPVREIPESPDFVKGVVNFRGKVIPVAEPRRLFGLPAKEASDEGFIIILELEKLSGSSLLGLIVDSVSEIANVKASDISDAPGFVRGKKTQYISALAKFDDKVRILVDVDRLMRRDDAEVVADLYEEEEVE